MWNPKKLTSEHNKKETDTQIENKLVVFIGRGRDTAGGGSTIEIRGTNGMNLEPIVQNEVKSEREKQILYINAYIWNLERWY